ncbi:MAG: septum site-determining protein MinD [Candidatus Eremiobacteraeota bacterium]|nr:septum site-determining protein MinD [Candidatus Eremiobacteraeota bacterium]
MGKVFVITSGKGGVGKTTATANLGAGLAASGERVVLIDTDIGLRNLDLVLGLENRIVFDLVDVVHGKCRSPRQAMIKDKRFENLYLIPASQSKDKEDVTPQQMKDLCENLKQEFDYILIDCPAGIEHGFKNAIAGADEAVIVTTPEVSAVRDADRIIGLLESEEKYSPRLILNRVRKDMMKKGQMMSMEDVQEILNIKLLGMVPEDEAIVVSSNKGEPAVLNSSSKAGEAYRQIVERMKDPDLVYTVSSDNSENLFGRLWK